MGREEGNRPRSEFDSWRFSQSYPPGIESYFWSLVRTDLVRRALEEAASAGFRRAHERILEVGCGTGVVVSALKSAGLDIWGVDIGRPSVVDSAQDRVTVVMDARQLAQQFRESIETLMFLDVVEHIENDVDFLKDTLQHFPNCSCVIITVPAGPEVWSKWDEHYGHVRRYTKASLNEMVRNSGLSPEHTRYFFRALYLAARIINCLGIHRSTVMRAPKLILVHRLAASLMIMEDKLLRASSVPGLSLICVASIGKQGVRTIQ
jgi:SAM-dependent methyltransferase